MATPIPDRKLIASNEEAHEKLSKGLSFAADVVGATLGPAGRNVLVERKFRTPIPYDDGYSAINNLILDDELENLGITALVDAANKASEHVGDGTSTTILLTKAIYDEGVKRAGGFVAGKSPHEIRVEIQEAKKIVLEKLTKMSEPVKTKEEIESVAIAAYANEEMAEVVAGMVDKVGENGIVLVEEGWGRETETEVIEGMKFAGKLAHGLFANTAEEGLKLEGTPILVTDFDFVNLNDARPIVTEIQAKGENGIIILANRYESMAVKQIIQNNVILTQNRNPFRIWLVKTPSFTPREFESFAIYVGAKYFSKEKKESVLEAKPEDLGKAGVFKIEKHGDGICLGGEGTKEAVDARIAELKDKLAAEKVKLIKARFQQEIASLSSAVGIIKVASPSEGETEHTRLKTKNAVRSAQAAFAEGAVRGGGLALKEIADELPEGNILKEPLYAPYKKIQENAGGKLKIPENLRDATKVVRTAVEQACSTGYLLINTGTIIAQRNEHDFYDSIQLIAEKMKDDS